MRLLSFGFDDVHPLWGGRAFSATDDLTAVVRFVDATRQEQRFPFKLTPEEWTNVERLLEESGLLEAEIPHRNGVPDEGRPTLHLTLASGEAVTKAKWANDCVPAFDRVHQHLIALSEKPGKVPSGGY